jgi:hypothetical protein
VHSHHPVIWLDEHLLELVGAVVDRIGFDPPDIKAGVAPVWWTVGG